MKSLLVLDVPYLAHRAYHALGDLHHGEVGTAVAFGVLRDIHILQNHLSIYRPVFCFDSDISLRQKIFPGYKASRTRKYTDGTSEEVLSRKALRRQIRDLRDIHLLGIGYRNVFWYDGYEADDLIARVVLDNPVDSVVIVSADKDLYQILRHDGVGIYNPSKKEMITREKFQSVYNTDPSNWVMVKAVAGCNSDDIPGVKGVGEITAAKYFAGTLKPHTKAFQAIDREKLEWTRRAALVVLPMPGLPLCKVSTDCVTREKWDAVCKNLGLKTLLGKVPTTEMGA